MKKSDAEKLSEIFGSQEFKFNGLSVETTIKIVQTQIVVDPIKEELIAAQQKGAKQFISPRLKELSELVESGKVMVDSEEAMEFKKLESEFINNMSQLLDPIASEEVNITIPAFSKKDFEDICKANDFKGMTPKLIYTLLVKEEVAAN